MARYATALLGAVALLGLVAACAASHSTIAQATALEARLNTLVQANEQNAEVAQLAAAATSLREQLEKEEAASLTLLPVCGSVMEYIYRSVVDTVGALAWPVLAPVGTAVAEATNAAWTAGADVVTAVLEAEKTACGKVGELYAQHAEAHVGKYVDFVAQQVNEAYASASASVLAFRANAVANLVARDASNAAFAEVAVDAFLLSQGGAVAVVVAWLLWRFVAAPILSFCCCCCRKRSSKRKRRAKAAVSRAQASNKGSKAKGANSKRKPKSKADNTAEASDDDDDDDLVAERMAAFVAKRPKGRGRRK